jgi:DNA-binding XRE family transcriptional regulator
MGLLQAQAGARIGVCEDSIHHWEVGDTEPALKWMTRIIEFLGYDPRPIPNGLGGRLRHWHGGVARERPLLERSGV